MTYFTTFRLAISSTCLRGCNMRRSATSRKLRREHGEGFVGKRYISLSDVSRMDVRLWIAVCLVGHGPSSRNRTSFVSLANFTLFAPPIGRSSPGLPNIRNSKPCRVRRFFQLIHPSSTFLGAINATRPMGLRLVSSTTEIVPACLCRILQPPSYLYYMLSRYPE